VRIDDELHINREPAEVFAFMSDPAKLSTWQPTTVAVRRQRQGPLVVGERFEEVHKALGRELSSTVEVAAYDAPRLLALHIVSGPMPLDGRWELEPSHGGTRLRFVGEADVRGLMRLTRPVLARRFRSYHERLKHLVEDGARRR
jgi:carbon monoxide dehydrogenase subunit G